jgi:hypothetical protein
VVVGTASHNHGRGLLHVAQHYLMERVMMYSEETSGVKCQGGFWL